MTVGGVEGHMGQVEAPRVEEKVVVGADAPASSSEAIRLMP